MFYIVLVLFEEKWDAGHPVIGKFWRRNRERIIPLFSYPPAIRKVIYTTNPIESVHMSLRKVTKNRGSFPNDKSMVKLLYLSAEQYIEKMDYADTQLEISIKSVYYHF